MAEEKALETRLREYAEDAGVEYLKFTSPGRRGVPDRLLIGTRGRMWFMELKAPEGVPSASQVRFMQMLHSRNIAGSFVYDFKAGKRIIDRLVEEE